MWLILVEVHVFVNSQLDGLQALDLTTLHFRSLADAEMELGKHCVDVLGSLGKSRNGDREAVIA